MDAVNQLCVLSRPGCGSNKPSERLRVLAASIQRVEERLWKLVFTTRRCFMPGVKVPIYGRVAAAVLIRAGLLRCETNISRLTFFLLSPKTIKGLKDQFVLQVSKLIKIKRWDFKHVTF